MLIDFYRTLTGTTGFVISISSVSLQTGEEMSEKKATKKKKTQNIALAFLTIIRYRQLLYTKLFVN